MLKHAGKAENVKKKNNKLSQVKKHLKEDIKTFTKEKADDKKLLKKLKK